MWRRSRPKWLGKYILPIALGTTIIVAALVSTAGFGLLVRGHTPPANAASGTVVPVSTSKAGTPARVQVQWSSKIPAPLAGERQSEQAGVDRLHNLKPAHVGPITKPSARTASPQGPQVANPSASSTVGVRATGAPLADSSFDIEQTHTVSSGVCPTDCLASAVMEPSIAADGAHLMMSGNWFAATSSNAGSTWGYLDPYTAFSSITPNEAFCCDQQVLYEPARNTMYWESLFEASSPGTTNSLVLAESAGTDLSSWCAYNLTPSMFGLPNTDLLDYPDIQYTTSNLFLTFNAYDSQNNPVDTYVARMSLDSLSTCASSPTINYMSTNGQNFTVALTSNAQGTMWFDSNWYTSGPGTGSSVRIWAWQDPQSSATFVDRTIPAWDFTNSDLENCGSADKVVTNWCTRLDSRRGSLYLTKANYKGTGPSSLGMAWSAGADTGNGHAFPYVQREYFNLAGFTYDFSDQLWSSAFAIAYPSFTSNYAGFIGGSFAYGGGASGGTDYYPSTGYLLDDGFSSNPPWSTYYVTGSGNASTWGDYNTTREFVPQGYQFIAGGWYISDAQGDVTPFEVVFGRGLYHNTYLRWANA